MLNNKFKIYIRKIISSALLLAFSISSVAQAQVTASLVTPQKIIHLSPSYEGNLLKGLRLSPSKPLQMDFIVSINGTIADQADENHKLLRYFLAGLTLPENDLWVNLSPYESDRIIPDSFGRTGMGREVLAQDYLLKQLTASLLYPEGKTGKEFWNKVYRKVHEQFGTTDIPIDTFNKIWIKPDKAVVYESSKGAYIADARLKVMLESDYLAEKNNIIRHAQPENPSRKLTKQALREILIPVLEEEVNHGKNFATLRQIYHSLVLAAWFKRRIRSSPLNNSYINKSKTPGVESTIEPSPQEVFTQYAASFQKGVFDFIKEEPDPFGESVPHRYIAGGIQWSVDQAMAAVPFPDDALRLPQSEQFSELNVTLEKIIEETDDKMGLGKLNAELKTIYESARKKRILKPERYQFEITGIDDPTVRGHFGKNLATPDGSIWKKERQSTGLDKSYDHFFINVIVAPAIGNQLRIQMILIGKSGNKIDLSGWEWDNKEKKFLRSFLKKTTPPAPLAPNVNNLRTPVTIDPPGLTPVSNKTKINKPAEKTIPKIDIEKLIKAKDADALAAFIPYAYIKAGQQTFSDVSFMLEKKGSYWELPSTLKRPDGTIMRGGNKTTNIPVTATRVELIVETENVNGQMMSRLILRGYDQNGNILAMDKWDWVWQIKDFVNLKFSNPIAERIVQKYNEDGEHEFDSVNALPGIMNRQLNYLFTRPDGWRLGEAITFNYPSSRIKFDQVSMKMTVKGNKVRIAFYWKDGDRLNAVSVLDWNHRTRHFIDISERYDQKTGKVRLETLPVEEMMSELHESLAEKIVNTILAGDPLLTQDLLAMSGVNDKTANLMVMRIQRAFIGIPEQTVPLTLFTEVEEGAVILDQPKKHIESSNNVLEISGRVDALEPFTHIQLSGGRQKDVPLQPDGSFTFKILLKPGELTNLYFTPFNEKRRTRLNFDTVRNNQLVIKQTSPKLRKEKIIAEILTQDNAPNLLLRSRPGYQEYLRRKLEIPLLRLFNDPPKGFKHLKKIVSDATPSEKILYDDIFKKFTQINQMTFPDAKNKPSLFFFQKWVIHELQGLLNKKSSQGMDDIATAILALDPGLGKTIIATSFTRLNKKNALVITPGSLVTMWEADSKRFYEKIHVILAKSRTSNDDKVTELKKENDPDGTIKVVGQQFFQFTEKSETGQEHLAAVNDTPDKFLIWDEGQLGNDSLRMNLIDKINNSFRLVLSATPFATLLSLKRMVNKLTNNLEPGKKVGLDGMARSLALFVIRLQKNDVLPEFKDGMSTKEALKSTPIKKHIDPNENGSFDLTDQQCGQILEIIFNWTQWKRDHNKTFKENVSDNNSEALAKIEAIRQLINDPRYADIDQESPKLIALDKIVHDIMSQTSQGISHKQWIRKNTKVAIVSRYRALTQDIVNRYQDFGAVGYHGDIKSIGSWKVNSDGNISDGKKEILFMTLPGTDEIDPRLIPSDSGLPLQASDYNLIQFQNNPDSRVLPFTFAYGSVGTTMTAANVLISADTPDTYSQEIQSEDRIHRIAAEEQFKTEATYIKMQSRYPLSFVERSKSLWAVLQSNGIVTFENAKSLAEIETKFPGRQILCNIYEKIVFPGTIDQIRQRNLGIMKDLYSLVMNGFGDEKVILDQLEEAVKAVVTVKTDQTENSDNAQFSPNYGGVDLTQESMKIDVVSSDQVFNNANNQAIIPSLIGLKPLISGTRPNTNPAEFFQLKN